MTTVDRIVELSESATYASVRYEQLVVRQRDGTETTVPLAELVALVLGGQQVVATQAALAGVLRHGGCVVVCEQGHLPVGLMLPLAAHGLQTERMIAQAKVSLPRRKRLWQQIVRAKISAQAAALRRVQNNDYGLALMANRVQSGDRTNLEASAAQRYWPKIFGDPDFRRHRDGGGANRLLNYGYAILRAAVARALCATGLHPSLGLHHHHRNNPWCLADDLMEPYRPLVDEIVARWIVDHGRDCPIDREAKSALVSVLYQRLTSSGESRTLLSWIERSASSLASAYLGQTDRIFFPEGLFHVTPN